MYSKTVLEKIGPGFPWHWAFIYYEGIGKGAGGEEGEEGEERGGGGGGRVQRGRPGWYGGISPSKNRAGVFLISGECFLFGR